MYIQSIRERGGILIGVNLKFIYSKVTAVPETATIRAVPPTTS
jgi:hypothetical protein